MRAKWMRVDALLELQRRAVAPMPDVHYREIGVRSFGKGLFIKDPVTAQDLGRKRVFEIRSGDLVVSNVFGWEGAVGLAEDQHDGLIGSHRFMTWTARSDDVNMSFMLEYFKSIPGVRALAAASPGSAGRNRTLSVKNLEAIRVPIPRREDQDRIASRLEVIAASVSAGEKFDGDHEPVTLLPRLLGDAFRAMGLPRVRLGVLCANRQVVIHPGESLRGAERFIGLEHVESHSGVATRGRPIGDETGRKLLFAPGAVTYGYLRPYLNKAWAADSTGLCSVEQFVLVPSAGVAAGLLSALLRSDEVLTLAVAATNGLQLPRLSLSTLLDFEVPDVRQLADPSGFLAKTLAMEATVRSLSEVTARRRSLVASILPATRNEIFSRLVRNAV